MRRSRTDTAESRKRIIEAATRLIREHGSDQVSVGDIMKAAGMTHGGFYVHFADKDALLAEATKVAFSEKLDRIDEAQGKARTKALRSYIDNYLTLDHVGDLAYGCPIAGLGPDAARGTPVVTAAMADGAERTIETFARDLAESDGDRRETAILALVTMVGSLVVARALKDRGLQKEVLEVARRSEPVLSNLSARTKSQR